MDYKYDALGRLLSRQVDGEEPVYYYYLGLNRIAEEQRGDETGGDVDVFRPDTEDSTDPAVNGWIEFEGGTGTHTIEYVVNDSSRGNVLHVKTSTQGAQDAQVLIGDYHDLDKNTNDVKFNDGNHKHMGLWIKNAKTTTMQVAAVVYTSAEEERLIIYFTEAGSEVKNGNNLYIYLDTSYNNQKWHYLERNLVEIR